jgi:hypothetical protein
MTSDPVELAFIQSIDGTRQLDVILERAEISRDKARLLLVALSEAGMIQRHETTDAQEGRAVAPPVSSMPVLGAPAAPPPATRAAGERPAVDDAADRPHAGLLWALDVERRRAAPPTSTAPTRRSRAASTPIATGCRPRRSQDGAGDLRKLGEAHRTLR